HEVRQTPAFQGNPITRVVEGGETLRRSMEGDPSDFEFSILHELKARGATEYVALPVAGAHGGHYAATFTTDRPGGFSEAEFAEFVRLAQSLAVPCDLFSQRALTRNLLNVYLGAKAGPKVLAGQIRRGTGEELMVVVWSSDLRGFTER